MQYAVSVLPVIPVRSAPSDTEEMVSQLVFGEQVTIIDKQQKWSFVENCYDGYHGWINNPMINLISKEVSEELNNSAARVPANLFLPVISNQNKHPLYIPAGSTLYRYKSASNTFQVGNIQFGCQQEPFFYSQEKIREDISGAALSFLNIPYLWGGKNPFGIDCSGLTQTLMKLFAIKLPRDSRQQVKTGKTVNFIDEAKPGDLAFFDNEQGEIVHTGIIIANRQIVHASGHVKSDRIDHQGIYDNARKQYTHRLRVIKNVIDNPS